MSDYLERESKWDIDERFAFPAFDDVYQGVRVAESTTDLTSTYFDTDDHDLLAHGLSLRQRVGGDDSGWQLKVPAEGGRTEIRSELSDAIPDDISELTRGVRLGKQLAVVATIHTRRDRYRLLTPEGDLIAEVADDHVHADVPSDHDEAVVWREAEVEAGPAGNDLSVVTDRLVSAGAKESAHSSKLERTLGVPKTRSSGPLDDYLDKQIDIVFAGDVGLRRRLDPIHDTRVAIRRLRSTLRVFGKLLDADAVGDLDTELKWFGSELGRVRDCQVQRKRFAAAIAELDPKLVVGPIARELDDELLTRQTHARSDVADVMDSPRYLAILAKLQHWTTSPPMPDTVTPKSLRKRARRAARKADDRLETALLGDSDDALHRARKAAKRARYAGELIGKKKRVKHYKKIQRVLGDHQDSVVARQTLFDVATTASGLTNTFTLGVLYTREGRTAARTRAAF
ncbi:CYTH and CHAD domain-containing protein [Smaragdicoccus niigatensis]|uniref:CYTH and CHAD domain-containing protein n=1 Tax=Smaragdicoccus niigatensis TaxID=359359 RepID=UPI00036C4E02|nr:CYTH and CHAD domain-containing protein [Smaragdicoccus niigatensis]